MKIAIMQPYIFPYIGYFQLINAVDKFVFYDDVNFIKRGWINRNQLLVNNEANLFSIPLQKVSQNKLINETHLAYDSKWLNQFYATLTFNYKNAPFFEPTFKLVKSIFETNHTTIAELCIDSIIKTSNHLCLNTVFEISSECYAQTKGMEKADRLISICKQRNAVTYINPSGGKALYNKDYSKKQGVDLLFIENNIAPYQQFEPNFVGGLSIIDVMMFNSPLQIKELVKKYQLI